MVEDFKKDGIKYRYAEHKKEWHVVEADKDIEIANILAEIEGKPVTSIGDLAFFECSAIESIAISASVTSVGESAFSGCDNLSSITLPNSIETIRDYAFYECKALQSITIPDSVIIIGVGAFIECTALQDITIPDTVIHVGFPFSDTAYYNNVSSWDNGVLYIGNHLIEANADIVTGNYEIRSGTKTIAEQAFFKCEGLLNVTIPDSVVSIGNEAFKRCKLLQSITIPASVTYFGPGAFDRCSSLATVNFVGTESDWKKKSLGADNEPLCEAKINFLSSNACEHSNTEAIAAVEASCTQDGLREGEKCADCGAVIKEQTVVSALGHNAGGWIVEKAATAEKEGLEVKKCTRCEEKLEERVIPKLTATFKLGDADGDGKITAFDARAALRLSTRLDPLTDELLKIVDVNKDGKVTAFDARQILRVSARLDTFE